MAGLQNSERHEDVARRRLADPPAEAGEQRLGRVGPVNEAGFIHARAAVAPASSGGSGALPWQSASPIV